MRGQGAASAWEDPEAMERRFVRVMCASVALAVAVSAAVAPWRFTTGLLLGGLLSLFNLHWLRSSVAAIFSTAAPGVRPRLSVARYVLRYFVVAAAVVAAHWLGVASVVATLAGLASFAVAVLVEGFVQTYFAIVNREEN